MKADKMLRKAEVKDINRIAEIIIFTKRQTYRPIFKNDNVSFNVMQVGFEIERLNKPHEMDNLYVYDDGIIKAIITIRTYEKAVWLTDFYVDPFFQGEGIGTTVLDTIVEKYKGYEIHANPLDQNVRTVKYYEKYGFEYTGNKEEFLDSGFYMLDYCFKA